MNERTLIRQLFDLGAIQFGTFTLKSGIQSPLYIDLRLTLSCPKLLVAIAAQLYEAVPSTSFDLLCGVPYTALPFATVISTQHEIPMVLCRKEKKEYGTAKRVEGIFTKGQTCLVVEDVITSGQSILETRERLQAEGLIVKDAVVFVNREQGGEQILAQKGVALHSVCRVTEVVQCLKEEQKISAQVAAEAMQFIRDHQVIA